MPQQSRAAQPAASSLSAELTAIEGRYQVHHWHCWHSDTGRLWAGSPHAAYADGSGYTVDAGSPECLEREIARIEREWEQVAGWRAA